MTGPEERRLPFEPGDRVAVIGLGRSGLAAARLASARGGRVYASDQVAGESQQRAAAALRAEGIDVTAGGHDMERLLEADLAVVSPGIGPTTEVRRELREAEVRTIAEIELAYGCLRSRIIGISGTNGKTTTTALCGHLLETAGVDATVAGNIGRPLSDIALLEEQPAWVVVELSSFQLADVERFRSDIGVMLNLAPDHLDRYRNVDSYYADKRNLFANDDDASLWVLNADDREVLALANGTRGRQLHFSVERRLATGAFLGSGRELRLELDGRSECWARVEELRLVGRHNVSNALAAGLAAALAGCDGEAIGRGLRGFEPLPHRLQPVLRDGAGVLWVDDSKATNVAATLVAVRAFEEPYVLLLGGRGKGEPFDRLAPVLRGQTRGIVAFGESAPRIVAELEEAVPEIRTESGMDGVVREAAALARPGDVVLFSPSCASYDMYPDYQERGHAFQRAVRKARATGTASEEEA